ncbi:MAG TPA: ABC transporter permease [Xanthomonadales bacterium]|nr:ABC transporter permease [Xanthomonadales bacterium]
MAWDASSPRIWRKLLQSLLLVLGVTFVSFLLMVWYGPDQTYVLIGKNAGPEQIAEVRHQLGYDRPFLLRYGQYLGQLLTLDLGHSNSTGEQVRTILARSLPVSLALVIPGFILGHLLGGLLGMLATWQQGRWPDRLVTLLSVSAISVSFLIMVIALQVLLCTPYGLNLFPARGWNVSGFTSYLYYVFVPTLALLLATAGYNARFYRAVFTEEAGREHIRVARAYGATTRTLLMVHVLKNSLLAVLTRIIFSLPLLLVSGSLLLETYFGIPGIGKITFDAITNGDQPVLKAVVGLTALLFVLVSVLADTAYRMADPRIR